MMTRSLRAVLRGRGIAAIEVGGFDARGDASLPDRYFDGRELVSPLSRDRPDGSAQAGPAVAFEARCAPSFLASSRTRRTSRLLRSGSALPPSAACGQRRPRSGCTSTGAASRFKRRRRTPPHSSAPNVLRRRRTWFDGQLDLDPERLIFINETAASTKMARLRGRSLRGERLSGGRSSGPWEDHHVHGRPAAGRLGDANAARWPYEWFCLPRLCAAGPRTRASPRRHRGRGQPARPQDQRRARGDREGWRGSCSCHRFPTSTRSRWLSRSSRLSCERLQPEPSTNSGRSWPTALQPSQPRNAGIISRQPATSNLL